MPGAGALAVLEASRVLDEVAIELPPVQTEVVEVFPAWTTVLEAPQAQQRRWQHQQQEERGPRHARPPAIHLFRLPLRPHWMPETQGHLRWQPLPPLCVPRAFGPSSPFTKVPCEPCLVPALRAKR